MPLKQPRKEKKQPVQQQAIDTFPLFNESFDLATNYKQYMEDAGEDYVDYGMIADIAYKAAMKAGCELQPAIQGNKSVSKAYRRSMEGLNRILDERKIPDEKRLIIYSLADSVLTKHWAHTTEFNKAMSKEREQTFRPDAAGSAPAVQY